MKRLISACYGHLSSSTMMGRLGIGQRNLSTGSGSALLLCTNKCRGREFQEFSSSSSDCNRFFSMKNSFTMDREIKMRVKEARMEENVDRNVTIEGWVRTSRMQKNLCFIEVNDGSCNSNLQVVFDMTNTHQGTPVISHDELAKIQNGASIRIRGQIIKSPGKGQKTELSNIAEIKVLGECPQEQYPLQKKGHTVEFLREISHLRSRTNTGAAVLRVRNSAMMAIHEYFQSQDFIQIHTPILTGSDCEGAGEQFKVMSEQHKDFFGENQEVFLTVSGQLEAEIFASSMSRVYTFGPTFRAEDSRTTRHLAEFWMVEMEQAFIGLPELVQHSENMIRHAVRKVLDQCEEDIQFFNKWYKNTLFEDLKKVASNETKFVTITYTDAVELLQKDAIEKNRVQFKYPVEWGVNLQSEHEVYLCKYFNSPVFVTNYPKVIKPFYARVDENGKTVSAVDLLVPDLGELIGGSVREERYDILLQNMKEKGMTNLQNYDWYLDLRKFGTVPHGGFGLGFERLILFLTGIPNIRETIPIYRAPGFCKF
ncbi:hypothetical protein C9374_012470 [Naegleria lovaniensis]|uniref:asparagine--tRNA ligase n=1 Tax=Naegleria lovaniensis TaxID=51637 RepID=A0AA88GZU4_NAELO|nr:uncharacterized protein C9374_012470 [Naegleria lovaniensis]KAG2392218.1 hypothetical protein C9374_012470 [Naegleria lovaniensis]